MNNAAEGFGFFAAAVFANLFAYAQAGMAIPDRVVALAGVIIGCRVFYTAFYLADLHALRSTCFFAQAICNFWLFATALTPTK